MLLLAIVLFAGACKTEITGEMKGNITPETYTVVDTILRAGPDRLNSEVQIRWWGDDPDGFVTGFEFSFDNTNWTFTTKNDSTFILSPPPGKDTLDFTFYVRAIDNENIKDPTPAQLTYPIKNSPPSVQFVSGAFNPVRTFPVIKFYFEGSDPDGIDNLQRYEIVWNDTARAPFTIPATASSATFVAEDVDADSSAVKVYINNNTTAENGLMAGLMLNSDNVLYIRAIDNSEATSTWKASYSIYVKKVSSNILLVNGNTSASASIESFYLQQLATQGFTNVDTLRIFEQVGGQSTQQAPDNLTQSRIFALFESIIWFSNSAQKSLPLAQKTTGNFFSQGGKLLMAVYISSSFDEQSQFLDFTPIQSLVNPKDTTLLLDNGAQILPQISGWPVLKSTTIVGIVKPMNLDIGSQALYDAELLARDDVTSNIGPWTGNSTVVALRKSGGQTNFIISTLELEKLNGNNNIDDFFNKVLKQEFGL